MNKSQQKHDHKNNTPLTFAEMQKNSPLHFFHPIGGCGNATKWHVEFAGKRTSSGFDTLRDLVHEVTFFAADESMFDKFRIVAPNGMKLNILAALTMIRDGHGS